MIKYSSRAIINFYVFLIGIDGVRGRWFSFITAYTLSRFQRIQTELLGEEFRKTVMRPFHFMEADQRS